jgi:hypothetical protein
MGYNISEVTGATGGGTAGIDTWTFNVALYQTGVTTVSGDFNEVPIGGGASSEATGGYSFTVTSGGAYGTLAFNATTGTFTFTIDRNAVFATGTNQTVAISVTGTDTQGTDTDTIFINLTICVARGTLIETEAGPVPVEDLCIGDMVQTADGPAQPVRWIGCTHVSKSELRADHSLRPIRISAGAFGENRPSRDLTVSPQHRILVDDWRAELHFGAREVLVPAKGLINDTTVRHDHQVDEIDYFHVLFDRHEIMLTEGLWTESFHPGDYALREIGSAAQEELLRLFPELADGAGAPETARMALRPWEGRLLQDSLPKHGFGQEQRIAA